ncbi:MAG: hypothetical protein ACFB4I_18510 [Cyanophyceae cyanobacterium]
MSFSNWYDLVLSCGYESLVRCRSCHDSSGGVRSPLKSRLDCATTAADSRRPVAGTATDCGGYQDGAVTPTAGVGVSPAGTLCRGDRGS